jgi:hypothetical protein
MLVRFLPYMYYISILFLSLQINEIGYHVTDFFDNFDSHETHF